MDLTKTPKIVQKIINSPLLFIFSSMFIAAVVSFGASKLSQDFSYRIWFEESSERIKTFDAFERRFGSDEVVVVMLHSPSGIFDKDSLELSLKLTEALWQAPEVIRVDSITNFNWVQADGDDLFIQPLIPDDEEITPAFIKERMKVAKEHPSIPNYLISKDLKTTVFYCRIKPHPGSTPDYQTIVNGFRNITSKYEDHTDHEIYLTGGPFLTYAFNESSQNDMRVLVPLIFFMTLLFLIFSFRRISGVIIPLIVVFVTVLMTLGFVGWLGFRLGTLTAIVPQFMTAISIAVIVHILVSFYQFIGFGLTRKEALKAALGKNLKPTILTCLSTAVGFLSYTTSEIPQISEMGIMAGAGTLFSWLITYLLIGPILLFIPCKAKSVKVSEHNIGAPSPLALKITDFLFQWRKIVLGGTALLVIICLFLATKVKVSSDPFEYFDDTYPMTIANHFMEDHIGGSTGLEMVLDSGSSEGIKSPNFLNKLEQFDSWIKSIPWVTFNVSILDILKDMNKNLNQGKASEFRLADTRNEIAEQLFLYTMNLPQGMDLNDRISIENDMTRMTTFWTLHRSDKTLKLVEEIKDKAKEIGLKLTITGKGLLYQQNNPIIVHSFIFSITIALFLVSIILIIGLNSVKIGLFSIIPNAIPLIMGAALLPLLGQTLDIGTVIVGSVCLGIAVDDTIHFLAAFKRQIAEGDTTRDAIAKIFTYTAPALITTTLVLVAAFGTFVFAHFVPNQNFGKFVAIILAFALIIDLTFLPALLMSTRLFHPKKNEMGSQ